MLPKNSLFANQGMPCRLLEVDKATNRAWIISMRSSKAMPIQVPWSNISRKADARDRNTHIPKSESCLRTADCLHVSERVIALTRKRMSIIVPVAREATGIFNAEQRGRLIKDRAHKVKCRASTIYVYLHRYWQGGQVVQALAGKIKPRVLKQRIRKSTARGVNFTIASAKNVHEHDS
jgi:hypothetical protein